MSGLVQIGVEAAAQVLKDKWPIVATDVAHAIARSVVRVEHIDAMRRDDEITARIADKLVELEKVTVRGTVLSFQVVSIETAALAVNAAFDAILAAILEPVAVPA